MGQRENSKHVHAPRVTETSYTGDVVLLEAVSTPGGSPGRCLEYGNTRNLRKSRHGRVPTDKSARGVA